LRLQWDQAVKRSVGQLLTFPQGVVEHEVAV